jgi:hypothetical protein
MKTFEEKFTAWVDGELKGRELAEFEAELPHALDARLDKLAAHQIGELFREHGRAPEMTNGDFFNHQLMQRIEAESAKPEPAPARRRFAWSLPRLAFAGAFSLLVAFGLYHELIPKVAQPQAAVGTFEVITSGTNTKIYYSPENNAQVVWIEEAGPTKPTPDKHASPAEKRKDKSN